MRPADHTIAGAAATRIVSRRIAANGLEIHYLEAGSGPPIVLLHGFPDHSGSWRRMIDRLAPHFHVIAPDLRGYGLTSRPVGIEAYAPALLVADVIGLLDALELARPALVGSDWGGLLALLAGAQAPRAGWRHYRPEHGASADSAGHDRR